MKKFLFVLARVMWIVLMWFVGKTIGTTILNYIHPSKENILVIILLVILVLAFFIAIGKAFNLLLKKLGE